MNGGQRIEIASSSAVLLRFSVFRSPFPCSVNFVAQATKFRPRLSGVERKRLAGKRFSAGLRFSSDESLPWPRACRFLSRTTRGR
jgi:hypothetical protein